MYRHFIAAVTCLKPVRAEWTDLRRVWHTSSSADGEKPEWVQLFWCVIRSTADASIPHRLVPLHSHHTTEICRQHSPAGRTALLDSRWTQWMTSYSCNQTRFQSVCVSVSLTGTSELSSLPNHITSTGTVTGGPLAPLKYPNTHRGHTHMHAQAMCIYSWMHIYSMCAQVHS